ncbi:hypothetical protein L226DRAFT_570332 [Lentinus tigrinus ALCF2SS1-7]|uniref:Uncharacterized protein n=1 Tax=Lentinus tigrinus ALCF2SS1-6 TaxID=1328759 RepID=A0A5C2SEB7_9APHY|nr:hypothetical protein L227DRAFT_574116 [Lentinus tigrinus ALCF2SS1-6]RPD76133.1 hypothetical protein L226DRAFT_570332 [Lentinus tigrinus ALCF2SS1-7]
MMRAPVRLPITRLARVASQTEGSGNSDSDCARLEIEDAHGTEEASQSSAVMSLNNFTGQLVAEWRQDSHSDDAKLTLTLCGKPRACKRRLYPERRQFKIRGIDRHVIWYKTADHATLKAPPAHLLRPRQHALYVHAHRRGIQAWMYFKDASERADRDHSQGTGKGKKTERKEASEREMLARWRRTYEGQEHPELDGYVLHFLQDGSPRWVRNVSAKAYEKRQMKRQTMCI